MRSDISRLIDLTIRGLTGPTVQHACEDER